MFTILSLDFIGGIIPLSLCIFSNFDVLIISLISVIKIVRLFDVLPGFTFLKKAFNDKKDEIFYSLLLVAFGSFIISCIIYFIESDNPDSPFKSVLDTLIWSFSKYTNDYGDTANFAPRSPLAKFCATINGLFGVAVFAVPGALLASAFVEQISDSKKYKAIEEKIKKITQLFEESLWEISEFSNRQDIGSLRAGLTRQMCVVDRFWTFESLQSYLLYTENEIIEVVRNSPNLVYRVLNDESSNNSNRHKIVELLEFPSYFRPEMNVLNYKKKSYGSIYNGGENRTLIVCTNGRSEPGILHFTATVANGKLLDSNIFKDIYIQPASGDAGGAIGAALAAYYIYFGKERIIVDVISEKNTDLMKGSYLGPSYNEIEIMETLEKLGANYTKYDDFQEIVNKIADEINSGKVIGWFQDRMEFGPRALGNRSIIADARNCEMQKKLNLKIKYREGFRPFAPAVLDEIQSEYFDLKKVSPYMLFVAPVNDKIKKQHPTKYAEMGLWDKLYFQRSTIPAVTHIDYSARIQSVRKNTNSKFHALLSCMQSKHNIGLVINTSFNVRGEPIVCSPIDAYICFMSTDMDILVINNFIMIKEKQVDWQNKGKWQKNYKTD